MIALAAKKSSWKADSPFGEMDAEQFAAYLAGRYSKDCYAVKLLRRLETKPKRKRQNESQYDRLGEELAGQPDDLAVYFPDVYLG